MCSAARLPASQADIDNIFSALRFSLATVSGHAEVKGAKNSLNFTNNFVF
jgi:hypothetical protein